MDRRGEGRGLGDLDRRGEFPFFFLPRTFLGSIPNSVATSPNMRSTSLVIRGEDDTGDADLGLFLILSSHS